MKRKTALRAALSASLIAVVAGYSWLVLSPDSPMEPEQPESAELEANSTGERMMVDARLTRQTLEDDDLPDLPRQHLLEGIAIDGQIRLDRNGRLITDRQLRRFMDFFIGLTQSVDNIDAMKKHMQAAMKIEGVPSRVQDEVMSVLDDYIDYRIALNELGSQDSGSMAELRDSFEKVYRLRREHLDRDVAEGFFGDEEERLKAILERQRIMEDDTLTSEQREELLAQMEQQMPEEERRIYERSQSLSETRQQVAEMREQGASEEDIRALRTERFGAEAAERLGQLDQRRSEWQSRVDQFQSARAEIENNEGLSEQDRQRAIEELEEEHFSSDAERRRARALSRIAAQQDEDA